MLMIDDKIGKGLWKGEDAQEYVNRLREDRM
jgi:hypothetical protein